MKSLRFPGIGVLLAAALAVGLSSSPSQAKDDGAICVIENNRIVCAKSARNSRAVFWAMTNPESRIYFENLLKDPYFELNRKRRERYRRSLEINRRALQRFANRQLRRYQRGRIDADTYQEIQSAYRDGLQTYRSALNVYRSTVWHDPRPPRAWD